MKKTIIFLFLFLLVVAFKYISSQSNFENNENTEIEIVEYQEQEFTKKSNNDNYFIQKQNFKCDGRQYCSQMTSCEEATFFLNNCPNPKMDGNGDGVPCEKQWCY